MWFSIGIVQFKYNHMQSAKLMSMHSTVIFVNPYRISHKVNSVREDPPKQWKQGILIDGIC